MVMMTANYFLFFKQNNLQLLQCCNIKDKGLEAIKSLGSVTTLLDVS